MQKFFWPAVIAAVVSIVVLQFAQPQGQTGSKAETVYERVLRTGVINCGYVVWNPLVIRDPNTGQFSGMTYEIVEALAREIGVKVNWVEETGWGAYGVGLQTNRFDLMCQTLWQSGQHTRAALLTTPVSREVVLAWKRQSEKRFNSLAELNDPAVRIAVVEGDVTQKIRSLKFSAATEVALASNADVGQYYLTLNTNKADIMFAGPSTMHDYNKSNPTQGFVPVSETPVRVFNQVLGVKPDEHQFKAMLDSAIDALYSTGELPAIIKKYHPGFIPLDK